MAVKRCVLCGADRFTSENANDGRAEVVTCLECGGIVRIEFDPADQPHLRGIIEVLVDPWDE